MFRRSRYLPPFHPTYYPSPYGLLPWQTFRRQFPDVDTHLFVESAKVTKPILSDVQKILDLIETSNDFSKKLMDAAQKSKMDEVNKMITNIGLQTKPRIEFNPEGLKLYFLGKSGEADCCRVNIVLRWS